MKMNKKIAVAGATLLSIVTLAACSNKSDVLVSMKTGDITSEKFFAEINIINGNIIKSYSSDFTF